MTDRTPWTADTSVHAATVDVLDSLASGTVPPGRDDLGPLVPLLTALRASAMAEPRPPVDDHLAALLWPEPLVLPERPRALRRALRSRRQIMVGRLLAVAAGFFGVGGLATAGALPAPLQATAAGVAQVVGIDLPGGDDEAPGGSPSSRDARGEEPGRHVADRDDRPSQRSNDEADAGGSVDAPTSDDAVDSGATEESESEARGGQSPARGPASNPDTRGDTTAGEPPPTGVSPPAPVAAPPTTVPHPGPGNGHGPGGAPGNPGGGHNNVPTPNPNPNPGADQGSDAAPAQESAKQAVGKP